MISHKPFTIDWLVKGILLRLYVHDGRLSTEVSPRPPYLRPIQRGEVKAKEDGAPGDC